MYTLHVHVNDGYQLAVFTRCCYRQKSKVKLSMCKVSETNILPKEMVTYSKETQTIVTEPAERDGKCQHLSQCIYQ